MRWAAVGAARRFACVVVVAGGAGLFASACTGGHASLGTTASPCFKALPPAAAAVHRQGKFVGVRKVTSQQLLASVRLRRVGAPATLDHRDVCAVAFSGNFRPGDVEHAYRQRAGSFAVVLVGATDDKVLVSFVLDRLPLQFRHL